MDSNYNSVPMGNNLTNPIIDATPEARQARREKNECPVAALDELTGKCLVDHTLCRCVESSKAAIGVRHCRYVSVLGNILDGKLKVGTAYP